MLVRLIISWPTWCRLCRGAMCAALSPARVDSTLTGSYGRTGAQVIGVRPETDLAKGAGLELGSRGGIKVDEGMRTSDPHIWAVGDAAEVGGAGALTSKSAFGLSIPLPGECARRLLAAPAGMLPDGPCLPAPGSTAAQRFRSSAWSPASSGCCRWQAPPTGRAASPRTSSWAGTQLGGGGGGHSCAVAAERIGLPQSAAAGLTAVPTGGWPS
jgi:hypothetical protein